MLVSAAGKDHAQGFQRAAENSTPAACASRNVAKSCFTQTHALGITNHMKQKYIALASAAILSFVTVTPPVLATSLHFKTPPQPSHQETIIENITPDTITIEIRTVSHKGKIEEKKSRAFGITKFTEIIVNGRKGTVADLKRGMRVNVTAGMDRTVASRIDANG